MFLRLVDGRVCVAWLTWRPSCTAAGQSAGPRRCPTRSPPRSAIGGDSQRLQPQSRAAGVLIVPYLKLQNVARLHDELAGGQDVVRVVLVLVGPVQVEGRVPAEAGRANSVGVEAPALLVRNALCEGLQTQRRLGGGVQANPPTTPPSKNKTKKHSPSSKLSSRVDGLMSEPPTRMLSMAHWALSRLGVARPEETVNGCHQRSRVALVSAPSGRTM